jgi:uncharacterized protein YjbI with pentapeptide repeats
MADKTQLALLKKGVKGWNKWRKENPGVEIDLKKANFSTRLDQPGFDLKAVNLRGVDLRDADLGRADLREADLQKANLERANLKEANLERADLWDANLMDADLAMSKLIKANLENSFLYATDLTAADLNGTNFAHAVLATFFVNVDLSKANGLDQALHELPSFIDAGTFRRSKGDIPEKFLRGCGLSDWEIESAKLYQPGVSRQEANDILYRVYDLRMGQALQINSLFISYSHKDSIFVDAMEKRLDEKGIRFWRDINDASSGRLEKVVDRAMRQNPTVLLVLSEHSVESDWVEHEARSARELEKELKRDVLCPVALDGAWKDCNWPARLREQIMEYNILDFSNWKDDAEFSKKFAKLVEGLDLFYKEQTADGG